MYRFALVKKLNEKIVPRQSGESRYLLLFQHDNLCLIWPFFRVGGATFCVTPYSGLFRQCFTGRDLRFIPWDNLKDLDLLNLGCGVRKVDSIPVEQLGTMDYPGRDADEPQKTREGMATQQHYLAIHGSSPRQPDR